MSEEQEEYKVNENYLAKYLRQKDNHFVGSLFVMVLLAGMFLIMFGLKIAQVDPVVNWSWILITLPTWGLLALQICLYVLLFFWNLTLQIFRRGNE